MTDKRQCDALVYHDRGGGSGYTAPCEFAAIIEVTVKWKTMDLQPHHRIVSVCGTHAKRLALGKKIRIASGEKDRRGRPISQQVTSKTD